MSIQSQTLETVSRVSAYTTYGAGSTIAGVGIAEEVQPSLIDWVNEYSIVIGLGIAFTGLMVNIAATLLKVYIDAKARKKASSTEPET